MLRVQAIKAKVSASSKPMAPTFFFLGAKWVTVAFGLGTAPALSFTFSHQTWKERPANSNARPRGVMKRGKEAGKKISRPSHREDRSRWKNEKLSARFKKENHQGQWANWKTRGTQEAHTRHRKTMHSHAHKASLLKATHSSPDQEWGDLGCHTMEST